jgi:hypothetical protein
MSTVFVTLCDQSYYPKACRTIRELQTDGQWTGDIVLIAVDFAPMDLPDGVLVWTVSHLDTTHLVEQLRTYPIRPMDDNRHFGKLYQWDKFYVFHSCFRRWNRVVFLDAGLRVFDTVQPLLDLPWKGRFLAPDDSDPYDNGNRFRCQVDLNGKPDAVERWLDTYSKTLDERYFLNCIFVYDTDLLARITMDDMVKMMNDFPFCMCNEMGILNMVFTFQLQVWEPFPQRVGNKYLFGWNELNYREYPTWRQFHFLKYSSSS